MPFTDRHESLQPAGFTDPGIETWTGDPCPKCQDPEAVFEEDEDVWEVEGRDRLVRVLRCCSCGEVVAAK